MENDSSVRSAAVSIYLATGSRNDPPEFAGQAHYLEHMLFKGTRTRTAKDIAVLIDRAGGGLSALTGREHIRLYAHVLSTQLEEVLDAMCEMLSAPLLSDYDIDLERGVILEELNMCLDDPDDLLKTTTYRTAWHGNSMSEEIIGRRESICAINSDNLRKRLERDLTAEQVVISVAGNFDEEAVVQICRRHFGALEAKSRSDVQYPALFCAGITLCERQLEQNRFALTFPTFAVSDKRYEALALLSAVLGGGYGSRLFQRLREELGLVYDVDCEIESYRSEGILNVQINVCQANEDAAICETLRILSDTARNGVSEKEFELAREQALVSTVISFESVAVRAGEAAFDELMVSGARSLDDIINEINSVTLEQVNELARQILNFERMAFVGIGVLESQAHYRMITAQAMQKFQEGGLN